LRQSLELSSFYQKHISVRGYPILGSTNVSDYAMREAAWILEKMTAHRPEILETMATNRARLVVMAHNEYTTDIPEQADMSPKVFWDRRARGLGGRLTSCAEENLLSYPNDPYSTENILIHEFSHAIMGVGMRALDPTFRQRVRETYENAKAAGLWEDTYAGSNPNEYWAEGAQSWFGDNRENDSSHNHVNTRDELREYDPELAKLCEEVFGDLSWRYKKPAQRAAADTAHLAGYDPSKAPRFRWRDVAIADKPRVVIQTELGEIEAELYPRQAPVTVSNFLHYVRDGYFRSGEFFRSVRMDNQPNDAVKIQVIQAEIDPDRMDELNPPIPLESTRDTEVRHLDGTLSMARDGPDTAQASFSICVGNQPELDFGGRRNPDGQGFAAFGRVTKGMGVVKRIHESPTEGQKLTPPIHIQAIYRLE
jgi:cyclophilin family peptidyl-prolyl cis-trans isomerase